MTTRHFGRIGVAMIAAIAAVIMAGCGGGGGEFSQDGDAADTSSLSGTVYSSGVVEDAGVDTAVWTAQAGDPGEPVPDCPVDVIRDMDQVRLRTGRTDDRGRFRFEGLPAGETVMVQARLRTGERLMARLQLRTGECQTDVNGDTTMAAVCSRLAVGAGGPADADDQELAREVCEVCLQYQARNRYRYGQLNGEPPGFDDQNQVDHAAGALLAAATDEALERAQRTRDEDDCRNAVRMLFAHLRYVHGERVPWSPSVLARLIVALREGHGTPVEAVANMLSRMLGQEITPDMMHRAIRQLRERIGHALQGDPPGLVEVVAAVCIANGDAEMVRLRTEQQVEALVDGLATAPAEGR